MIYNDSNQIKNLVSPYIKKNKYIHSKIDYMDFDNLKSHLKNKAQTKMYLVTLAERVEFEPTVFLGITCF